MIICRDLQSVRRLSSFNSQAQSRYILASDDPRVHEAVKECSWIDKVCWIEQMESFHNVADDVIGFLKIINRWLESLADAQRGIPKELLYWIQHCEGGMTTQRIQDLLLLIRSYLHLFNTYHIGSIIIFCHPEMHWEDDVLIETAKSRGINVEVIGRFRTSVLVVKIASFLKMVAREPYYTLKFLRSKFRSYFRFGQNKVYDKEIVLQLCSSAYKHVVHIIPLMKALKNRGYNPVSLCWKVSDTATYLRSKQIRSVELEKFVPISSIWEAPYRVFRTFKEAVVKKNEFLFHSKLQYQSVALGNLLWQSVRYFLLNELTDRYRIMTAAKNYFAIHSPLAIRLWSIVLVEGVILWKSLPKDKKLIRFRYYPFHDHFENPYEDKTALQQIDLFLVLGKWHKEKLEKDGVLSNKIEIIGQISWEHYHDFRKNYTPNYSRSFLKISLSYSTYIFYDPSAILRGYCLFSEYMNVLTFVLDFAKRNESVALIIKPHPTYTHSILKGLINSYRLRNVFLIEKSRPIDHCLNSADIIITKHSTIGMESMFFEKPVISVLLDREKKFQIYENAAEYVYNIEELNNLLTLLIRDTNYMSQWTARLRANAKVYLDQNFYRTSQLPAELAAEAIDRSILLLNSGAHTLV